jgi:hypothetical protein
MQQTTAALRAEETHPEVKEGGYIPAPNRNAATFPDIKEQLYRQVDRHRLTPTEVAPIERMLDAFEWGERNLPEGATAWALVGGWPQRWEDYPSVVLKAHKFIAEQRQFVTDVTTLSRLTRIARTSSSLALLRQLQPYLLKMVPVQLGERFMSYSADEVRKRVSGYNSNGRNDEFCLDSGTISDIFAMCPEVLPAPDRGVVAGGDSIDRDHVPVYLTDSRGHLKVVTFDAHQAHRSHGQATGYLFRPKHKR